MPASGQVYVMS